MVGEYIDRCITGVSFEIILDLFSKGKVRKQIINKTTGTALIVKSRVLNFQEFLHRLNELPAGRNSASPSNLQFVRYALRNSGCKGITSEVPKLLRDYPMLHLNGIFQ